ncbi:MAG: hypothetical protein KF859_08530 [Phycisphaeraceae bacterium]|nr:hypothetical protein [Phycisphaeraceae bacterium]
MSDPRDEFISRVVKGRSFVDVGGLWGTVAEKPSVAWGAGASRVGMFDITPEGESLWQRFHERLKEKGVPECECRVGDVAEYAGDRYDVVHCAGVLYHHPNPLQIITGLRRMAGEYLVFTSAITQTHIENEEGRVEVPESGVLFIPALTARERAVLTRYWAKFEVAAEGITHPAKYHLTELNATAFGPWWFLPTAHAFKRMTESCGFECIDERSWWNNNAHTLLCRVVA